jgi:RNA 2',3'-cyclic 3'-phosphodiesterase
MATETVRAFIAVELPEETGEAVWQVQDELQSFPPLQGLNWVDPFDTHITLKFLGDLPIPQLPSILDALDSVAERWEPFTIKLGSLGAFPNVQAPSVLWLGLEEGEKPLTHLYNAIEVALKKIGIRPERRDFHPHLTLARVPRSWTSEQQRAAGDLVGPTPVPDIPPFQVEAVALMRSLLTPEGAHYMRLGNARFGAAPPLQDDDWEDIL